MSGAGGWTPEPVQVFAVDSSANHNRDRNPEGEIGVMAGTTDKAKGMVKEGAGKATGDKRIESEGKVDRAKGEVKDAAHQAKESAKGVRDSLKKD
jgi:uncharacterized protein YjbJ (UPF0337 family)